MFILILTKLSPEDSEDHENRRKTHLWQELWIKNTLNKSFTRYGPWGGRSGETIRNDETSESFGALIASPLSHAVLCQDLQTTVKIVSLHVFVWFIHVHTSCMPSIEEPGTSTGAQRASSTALAAASPVGRRKSCCWWILGHLTTSGWLGKFKHVFKFATELPYVMLCCHFMHQCVVSIFIAFFCTFFVLSGLGESLDVVILQLLQRERCQGECPIACLGGVSCASIATWPLGC